MNVYYGTNFWGSRSAAREVGKEEKALQEQELLEKVALNQEFCWGDMSGFIPAIYVGDTGIAIDLCIRVSNDVFQAFYDKWLPKLEGGLSRAQEQQVTAENPMNIDFGLEISVNGEKLENDFGCSTGYSKITEAEYQEDGIEEQLVQEYQCDDASSWCFKRHMCKWQGRPEKISNIELNFIAGQKDYIGAQVAIDLDSEGKKYEICHPFNHNRYELCVNKLVQQEISREVLDTLKRGRHDWEYPSQYLIISYTVEPEISQEQFRLQDVTGGDSPRNMQAHENGAVSVLVGADGPTSIFIAGKRKDKQEMIAVSSMYFEPVTHVSLSAIFMEKEREDMQLRINLQSEENS